MILSPSVRKFNFPDWGPFLYELYQRLIEEQQVLLFMTSTKKQIINKPVWFKERDDDFCDRNIALLKDFNEEFRNLLHVYSTDIRIKVDGWSPSG